jgi:hypothetical protein
LWHANLAVFGFALDSRLLAEWRAMLVRLICCALLAMLCLCGCSDLKFVNVVEMATDEADPREDVQLTGVTADMTSGGLVQRRILSDNARWSQARAFLQLDAARVESFDSSATLESETRADEITMHLADKPALGRVRDDIEFIGNVHHRVPQKDDPTSDVVTLQTEKLMWDQRAERFLTSNTYFTLRITPPNGNPLTTIGDGFVATRDLRSWAVQYGGITTNPYADIRQQAQRERAEAAASTANDEKAQNPPLQADPIELPVELGGEPADSGMTAPIKTAPTEQIIDGRKHYRLPQLPPPAPAPGSMTPDREATPRTTPTPAPTARATPRVTPRATPRETPVSNEVERALQPRKRPASE